MLALTVEADVCINLTPSVYHAAWTVRAGHHGGIERYGFNSEHTHCTGNTYTDCNLTFNCFKFRLIQWLIYTFYKFVTKT